MNTYEVSLVNSFDANSPEDAIGQMATWAGGNAYSAGYRVTDLITGESVFIDADDIDWSKVSEETE